MQYFPARLTSLSRATEPTPMPRPWVAIDFETASRERASACALGIAIIDGAHLVETRSWLIQPPGNYFEPMNTRIHGIDEDQVAQSPEFDEVWPEISEYLDGAVLIAHNAAFDIGVLRGCIERYELAPLSSAGYHCTVTMARKVWPSLPNHRLDCVCGYCGIGLVHHDAASDAEACARVALRCRDDLAEESLDALVRRLGMTARRV